MQHSNRYIVIFAVIVTVVLGSLLSTVAIALKPAQEEAIAFDTKKEILKAVMDIQNIDKGKILDIYKKQIESYVFNSDGNELKQNEQGEKLIAEKVKIARESKKITQYLKDKSKVTKQIYYPLFVFKDVEGQVQAYIIPLFGKGLWDVIWGYLAIKTDLKTIKGVSFSHKSETPGLGARIANKDIQDRFKAKKLYDQKGNFVSVSVLKGEGNLPAKIDDHHVDGMSGATITGNGVNDMIQNYVQYYLKILNKINAQRNL